MKTRSILLLLISVVLGFMAIGWLRNQYPGATEANTPYIVVAKGTLNFGDHIGTGDVRLVKWPTNAIPQGAFTKTEDVAGSGQDRVVLRPMEADEPVLASKVTGTGGRASLSTVIEPTMRAVTIRVNDATGVAGFVLPGDRVDIMLTRDKEANRENPKTDVLLQNIKVLGIDQEANEKKNTPTVVKAVTVEVSPFDVQKLTLGGTAGTLSLSLRNVAATDHETHMPTLSLRELDPENAAPSPSAVGAPPAPAVHERTLEIVRGTSVTTYAIKNGSGAINHPAAQAPAASPKPTTAIESTTPQVAARN